uniref:Transmembrane protein n=1 Tax=Monopterus albus TaxID=43700 RepID=A0A3Q3Q3D7_MONAL
MRKTRISHSSLCFGFSTASLSFLASKRGLYSRTGRRLTKEGTSTWLSLHAFFLSESFLEAFIWRASHIFNALGPSVSASGSGNSGSSGSTTMCFLSRVHPLRLPLRPFCFWAAFSSADEGDVAAIITFLSAVENAVDVTDFMEGLAAESSNCVAEALVFTRSWSLSVVRVFVWSFVTVKGFISVVGVWILIDVLHTLGSGSGEALVVQGLVTVGGLCGTLISLVASARGLIFVSVLLFKAGCERA